MADYSFLNKPTPLPLLLAQAAAWADGERVRADALAEQLDTVRRVGIAAGLIMADYRLTATQADDVLNKLAADAGLTLGAMATDLVAYRTGCAVLQPAAVAS